MEGTFFAAMPLVVVEKSVIILLQAVLVSCGSDVSLGRRNNWGLFQVLCVAVILGSQ